MDDGRGSASTRRAAMFEAARRLATESRRHQGLPDTVTDVAVLAHIARLIDTGPQRDPMMVIDRKAGRRVERRLTSLSNRKGTP